MKPMGERLVGYILGMLTNIDKEMLIDMIKNNAVPQIFDYRLPSYFNGFKSLLADYKDQILEGMNVKKTIELCLEYRPDLAPILQHPKGRKWLDSFLKLWRFLIKNIELPDEEIRRKFYASIKQAQERKVQQEIDVEQIFNEAQQTREQATDKIESQKSESKINIVDGTITDDYI